ncbi:MAG: sodium-translocating pyrophosphatase [Candidatus Lokiarchaeota archaeon]|nr:sodium-translocating pyrophosphatase [Candidatus Lokiarchaeota archaeon]MBD3340409.1 sodium-translocating pyrophosphatase [Candidatus Lokiarchaeota archaeon]
MAPIIIYVAIVAGIISIVMAILFAKKVMQADPGNERMVEVAGYIESGANTFIRRQYVTLTIFIIVLSIALLFLPSPLETGDRKRFIYGALNWEQSIAYVVGSVASMCAGWLGMKVGVKANTRSAQGCTRGSKEGFDVAFFGGAVMGLAVVGTALIGVSVLYLIFVSPLVILGFSFGASSVALFMKCGGGIYTKTADVGADLVGKAEYKLPEDDPRNPASIADNVGDNVGDIAGMGSDLFDSYVASIVAAMLLAAALVIGSAQPVFVVLPIVLCGVGLLASLLGIFIIKWFGSDDPGKSLNAGTYISTLFYAGLAYILILVMTIQYPAYAGKLYRNYIATVVGLASGIVIGFTSDYYTREDKKPTKEIANAATQGDAVVILSGFSYGLISVAAPAVGIVIAMAIAYILDGVFGVAMAAVGMLAIVGTIVSNDAYGPIVDNARGIAEQGELGEDVIRTADKLDMAGNTAKAITKGFAIGAANLTVLALLFSYSEEAGIELIDLISVRVLIGAFIGVVAPAIFSALLIMSVQRNAGLMVEEIRRQFEENPKILTGEEPADFNRCIDIATKGALRELVLPSIISILIPILVGIVFGVAALGAFLAGAILSGFVFAIFMSNSGGSWDNAKKYIEDGALGGKGTDAHKASITGDTVGDPFKDTAGPSINTLLVVMSLTASIFMGLLLIFNGGAGLISVFL